MYTHRGFTLVEILIAVAIISGLMMIIVINVNDAREKARDDVRTSDLQQIQVAIELYFEKCGTYLIREECGAGEYYGAQGKGWFSHDDYEESAGSIAEGLVAHNLLGSELVDPSGVRTTTDTQSGYIVDATDTAYTIWANLEDPTDKERGTMDTCALSTYDNYDDAFPEAAQMNFCVSS